MRFGIPVFGSRIAPRCTIADAVLVVTLQRGELTEKRRVNLEQSGWEEILAVIGKHRVDSFICGGIARDEKARLSSLGLAVVDNVACTTDEVIAAIVTGCLRPGLGFDEHSLDTARHPGGESAGDGPRATIDCLACSDRVCMRGKPCRPDAAVSASAHGVQHDAMLECARDITLESEPFLCRLSELIYFCLEMKYHKIGLAYCVDLSEPAQILAGVLRRFFDVVPVCCKVGGVAVEEPFSVTPVESEGESHGNVACNPVAQAKVLDRAESDLNVAVGLCLGVDCVFAQASAAPVTTLFVKDKSLANNPIGAVYSDYYLREALRSARTRIAGLVERTHDPVVPRG